MRKYHCSRLFKSANFLLHARCDYTVKNKKFLLGKSYCYDFHSESKEELALGVVFFLQTKFDFLTNHFWWKLYMACAILSRNGCNKCPRPRTGFILCSFCIFLQVHLRPLIIHRAIRYFLFSRWLIFVALLGRKLNFAFG